MRRIVSSNVANLDELLPHRGHPRVGVRARKITLQHLIVAETVDAVAGYSPSIVHWPYY